MFVCLFDYYPATVIIFAKYLYCFDFVIQPLFSSIITNHFLFHFFICPLGENQDIEFERDGLALPVRCMGTPFKVSINYFVLFILQRVVSVCFLSYP